MDTVPLGARGTKILGLGFPICAYRLLHPRRSQDPPRSAVRSASFQSLICRWRPIHDSSFFRSLCYGFATIPFPPHFFGFSAKYRFRTYSPIAPNIPIRYLVRSASVSSSSISALFFAFTRRCQPLSPPAFFNISRGNAKLLQISFTRRILMFRLTHILRARNIAIFAQAFICGARTILRTGDGSYCTYLRDRRLRTFFGLDWSKGCEFAWGKIILLAVSSRPWMGIVGRAVIDSDEGQ